jgi:hypothetical protein
MSDPQLERARAEKEAKLRKLYGFHEDTENLKPEGETATPAPARRKPKKPGERKEVKDD